MRINMGGSGASGDTRSLEVRTLITAAQARAKDYETLKTQFQELKRAFQQITSLGRAFQGKGADAIKQFYRAQADVVDTWLDLIDKQIAYYRSIPGAIDKKHLDGQTSVQVSFLEDDLATGYYRSKEMIVQQREEIGKILSRISDLVPLTLFSTHAVDQALDQAEDERRKMATDARDLDQQLTAEYQKATEGLPRVAALYGELIHATRQGAEVQPIHFNTEAFHASKAYQLYNEGQKQRKARMEKEAEASLPFDLKMKLMENKIERGIRQGLIDTITDTIGGIVETARHPIQTSVALYQALSNWNLTSALLAQSISGSYERNMVHGDASTRSRWITYALATIATSVFGSKGMDKVGKATDVAKLGSMASGTVTKVGKVAGEWTQAKVNQAASRVSGKMSYFEMPRLGPEPVLAGEDYLPYHNVVNAAGIKVKLSEIAKGMKTNSFYDQINNVRGLIQQASVRKVSSASNKDNVSRYKYSFNTNSFSGTLKGDNVTLENIYFENIKYTKRDREEFNQLRKKFDSSVRSNFAKNLVSNEYLINSLKNSGLSNSDISMLKLGKIPRGYNVHHKLPLDDGGTNDFSNLVLIKNHPYHKILTKYQIAKTGHMQEGDSIELKWPIPKKYIYPFETVGKED